MEENIYRLSLVYIVINLSDLFPPLVRSCISPLNFYFNPFPLQHHCHFLSPSLFITSFLIPVSYVCFPPIHAIGGLFSAILSANVVSLQPNLRRFLKRINHKFNLNQSFTSHFPIRREGRNRTPSEKIKHANSIHSILWNDCFRQEKLRFLAGLSKLQKKLFLCQKIYLVGI